jgi:hypothetical protein
MTLSRIVLITLCAFIATIYGAFRVWETTWYKGLIPAAIEIDKTILIDGQSGFREGCGVAIFTLSDAETARIRSAGLDALADAHDARSHPWRRYFRFGEWKETPYAITGDGTSRNDTWLVGMECADISEKLRKQINIAMGIQGSFYSNSRESGLIVIPSLGLIVLSYEG